MPETFNLVAFADRLRGRQEHRPLVGTIDKWADRHSRLVDFRHARDLLKHFHGLGAELAVGPSPKEQPTNTTDIQGALFAQAVILYARAAEAGDKARKHTFNLKKAFSPHQLLLHELLMRLRNRVIAHVDFDPIVPWTNDVAVVTRHEDAWEYGFSYSRTMYQAGMAREFTGLLDHCVQTFGDLLGVENDQLHAAFERAFSFDRTLAAELELCRFDPQVFFGGGEAARAIEAAILAGRPGNISMNVNLPMNGGSKPG